jgi:hypothetical protein
MCTPLKRTLGAAPPTPSPGGEVVIEGLTSGERYSCAVTASNGAGAGEMAMVEVTPN